MKNNKKNEFDTLVRRVVETESIFTNDFASQYELQTLVRFMPNLASASVLDIGCGTGRMSLRLAKIAKRVVGIDTSGYSIKTFLDQAKKERLHNVSAFAMDFHDLPNKKKFDYVLMVNVVHHIPDIDKTLAKIRRILRKNGTLVIYEFNPINLLYIPFLVYYKQVAIHVNREYFRSNIWALRRILDRAGYSPNSMFRHGFLPTILYNVSPLFLKLNTALNAVPMVNQFCAFHILTYKIRSYE